MSKIIFLTGNSNKVREAKEILGIDITNISIDLTEIQSTNVADVAKHKVLEAYKQIGKPCFVEDTGLYINSMNGFPGALIKFYYEKLGNNGIAEYNGGSLAYAECIIAYYDGKHIYTFEGRVNGEISGKPKGEGFGWDPIFIPLEQNPNKLTFGEMTHEQKNAISMRGKAFRSFGNFLRKNKGGRKNKDTMIMY